MRIKLDENLPRALVQALGSMGHDVDTVGGEGLASRPDSEVWDAAQRVDRFFITQDLDFSDLRKFEPGTHRGLLLVRLAAPGRLALARRVGALFATEDVESWSGAFVVATERKVRVRRPPSPGTGRES